MDKSTLTGLAFLEALKNGDIKGSAMSQLIPMKLVTAEFGYIEYEIKPDYCHENLQGGVHGGFYATILDSATGAAVRSTLPSAAMKCSTIDLNIKMLKPLQFGKTYKAIGKVIRTGRTVLTSEASIVDAEGEIYAFGSATLLAIHSK